MFNIKLRNLGTVNKNVVTLVTSQGDFDFFFSYETCIAFSTPNGSIEVSENLWGPTTGKFLAELGSKSNRVPRPEFERLLNETLNKFTAIDHIFRPTTELCSLH